MQESQEGGSTQCTQSARFCWHNRHGFSRMEKGASLSCLHTVFFFFPFQSDYLPKCRSSPNLEGIPPAFGGVWQWMLHSHLHLPCPDAGWWSCGSWDTTNQTHSGLRSLFSQKVEKNYVCPAQGLFPFPRHCLLMLALQVWSPQAPHHHLFLLLHI